jgi:hypothetical protein
MLFPFLGEGDDEICLNFIYGSFHLNDEWKGFQTDSSSVARLILRKSKKVKGPEDNFLYEGVFGEHNFLSPIHQFLNRQREKFKKSPLGNVSLQGNLHDQVRIAYSIPRIVSLITLKNNEGMNMFPTDLHGSWNDEFYVSSLRSGGLANDQVEKCGVVALSFMPADQFSLVYTLGKNHMKEMTSEQAFRLSEIYSSVHEIPIPEFALRYIELERFYSVNVGLHQIHIYKKLSYKEIQSAPTLAHVHQYCAQWRVDHGIETQLLLR